MEAGGWGSGRGRCEEEWRGEARWSVGEVRSRSRSRSRSREAFGGGEAVLVECMSVRWWVGRGGWVESVG